MQNTEALLFVDDHEAKILKNDISGNETVGADNDVNTAFAQQLENFLLLCSRSKPAQHLDAIRVIQHSLAERLEMLLCQHSCRSQHCGMSTIHDRCRGSANRRLRF